MTKVVRPVYAWCSQFGTSTCCKSLLKIEPSLEVFQFRCFVSFHPVPKYPSSSATDRMSATLAVNVSVHNHESSKEKKAKKSSKAKGKEPATYDNVDVHKSEKQKKDKKRKSEEMENCEPNFCVHKLSILTVRDSVK